MKYTDDQKNQTKAEFGQSLSAEELGAVFGGDGETKYTVCPLGPEGKHNFVDTPQGKKCLYCKVWENRARIH